MSFQTDERAPFFPESSSEFAPISQTNLLLPLHDLNYESCSLQPLTVPPELSLDLDLLSYPTNASANVPSVSLQPVHVNSSQECAQLKTASGYIPNDVPASNAVADSTCNANRNASTDSSTRKQKINISYIDDNRKRQVSFCKRKNGAMKKGRELVRFLRFYFAPSC